MSDLFLLFLFYVLQEKIYIYIYLAFGVPVLVEKVLSIDVKTFDKCIIPIVWQYTLYFVNTHLIYIYIFNDCSFWSKMYRIFVMVSVY